MQVRKDCRLVLSERALYRRAKGDRWVAGSDGFDEGPVRVTPAVGPSAKSPDADPATPREEPLLFSLRGLEPHQLD